MGTCTSKNDSSKENIQQPEKVVTERKKEEMRMRAQMDLMKGEKTEWMLSRKDKFLENYRIGMLIGTGTYGEVRVCQHIRTKNKRAVRILKKALLDDATVNKFMTMTLLLQHLDHPNVLRFQEIF